MYPSIEKQHKSKQIGAHTVLLDTEWGDTGCFPLCTWNVLGGGLGGGNLLAVDWSSTLHPTNMHVTLCTNISIVDYRSYMNILWITSLLDMVKHLLMMSFQHSISLNFIECCSLTLWHNNIWNNINPCVQTCKVITAVQKSCYLVQTIYYVTPFLEQVNIRSIHIAT